MDRDTAEEIKRHVSVVAEDLRSEVRTVAEGVVAANERLDRLESQIETIESRLEREFIETRAMIRLSFGELDRRLRSLESDVISLRARLEKLEGRLPS